MNAHSRLFAAVTGSVGDSAWTPQENTYYNFLTIDLKERKEIKSIATKGRRSTLEFVTEYIVQYSNDGHAWKSVTDPEGDTEVCHVIHKYCCLCV